MEGCEQVVEIAANEAIGNNLVVSNTRVKWWGEEVLEAKRFMMEVHAR